MSGRGRHARPRDGGESLIEILLSIMIIGLAVTAILGGVGLAARASTQDERQIQAQALLRSWAEHVQASTTDASYVACATPSTYATSSAWGYPSPAPAGLQALPAGFTPSVTEVRYWDGATPGAFVATCGTDRGLQRLRLSMAVPDGAYPGFTTTYDVVVRRPCAALAASGGPGC